MFAKKGRFVRECEHPNNVVVRNSGIERTVCETCGHVSFKALEELTGSVERKQFERDVERVEKPIR